MSNAENQSTPRSSEAKTIFLIAGALLIMALFVGFMQWNKGGDDRLSEAATFTAVEKPEEVAVVEPTVTPTVEAETKLETVIATPEQAPSVKETVVDASETGAEGTEPETTGTPAPETDTEVAAIEETSEEPQASVILPSFDLVRVDRDGSSVIAGAAAPNSTVRLMADGKEIATAQVGPGGAFAFVTNMPKGTDPLQLQLEQVGDQTVVSEETVLVMPSPKNEDVAPMVVVAEADGKVVVQEQGELGPNFQALSLDTINYSASGDVVFTGRGKSEQSVRVYVDNQPVVLGPVNGGSWSFEIPDIKEGIYTVRVDSVDNEGKVVERVESPFQRVVPDEASGEVTIQPGFTLWQLAEKKYGTGDRYVQIFEANRDIIKDPDMIFPGQIFAIPEE